MCVLLSRIRRHTIWPRDWSSDVFSSDLTLQKLPEVDLAEKPRMADFAEVLAALDLATGASGLEYYTLSQESVASSIVATDDFLVALAEIGRASCRERVQVSVAGV